MSDSNMWKLFYWQNEGTPVAGRAEFIRLLFEEADVKYEEVNGNMLKLIIEGEYKGYPAFAPPMISKGKTNVIRKSGIGSAIKMGEGIPKF